jgi:hypothetical protein
MAARRSSQMAALGSGSFQCLRPGALEERHTRPPVFGTWR